MSAGKKINSSEIRRDTYRAELQKTPNMLSAMMADKINYMPRMLDQSSPGGDVRGGGSRPGICVLKLHWVSDSYTKSVFPSPLELDTTMMCWCIDKNILVTSYYNFEPPSLEDILDEAVRQGYDRQIIKDQPRAALEMKLKYIFYPIEDADENGKAKNTDIYEPQLVKFEGIAVSFIKTNKAHTPILCGNPSLTLRDLKVYTAFIKPDYPSGVAILPGGMNWNIGWEGMKVKVSSINQNASPGSPIMDRNGCCIGTVVSATYCGTNDPEGIVKNVGFSNQLLYRLYAPFTSEQTIFGSKTFEDSMGRAAKIEIQPKWFISIEYFCTAAPRRAHCQWSAKLEVMPFEVLK